MDVNKSQADVEHCGGWQCSDVYGCLGVCVLGGGLAFFITFTTRTHFLHYIHNKDSLSSLPLQGLTFFIIFTRTHLLHYLYNSDSLSSLPLQEGLAFFITFTTRMRHFQNFELGAQCIKVDGPIDAVVDIQLVDVEVGESHAQGVVGEHSHEDPVQDLGNVLHAQ